MGGTEVLQGRQAREEGLRAGHPEAHDHRGLASSSGVSSSFSPGARDSEVPGCTLEVEGPLAGSDRGGARSRSCELLEQAVAFEVQKQVHWKAGPSTSIVATSQAKPEFENRQVHESTAFVNTSMSNRALINAFFGNQAKHVLSSRFVQMHMQASASSRGEATEGGRTDSERDGSKGMSGGNAG